MPDLVRKNATSTTGGELSNTTQTIPGNKTFTGSVAIQSTFTASTFCKYKNEAGNITGTAITSSTDAGTLVSSLSYIDIPRAGVYRVFVSCGGTGTTTLNNGIRVMVTIKKAASLGAFGSATQLGSRGFNQSQNGSVGSNRPYAMASAEYIGALALNDRIYFSVDYYDNPNSAGTLGGGTLEAGTFIVQELVNSSMS